MPASEPETASAPPLIVISHSERDQEWVDRLSSLLPTDAVQLAFNRVEGNPGRIDEETKTALTQAKVIVVMLSPSYLANSWVAQERANLVLELEKEHGLRVIPILVHDCAWREIPFLRKRHWITNERRPIADYTPEGQTEVLRSAASRILQFAAVAESQPKTDSTPVSSAGESSVASESTLNELSHFRLSDEVAKIATRARVLANLKEADQMTITSDCLLFAIAEMGREKSAQVKTPQFLWRELTRRGATRYGNAFNAAFPAQRANAKSANIASSQALTSNALKVFELAQTFSRRTIKLEPPPGTNIAPPASDGRIHTRHLLAALLELDPEDSLSGSMYFLTSISTMDVQELRERFFDFIVESVPDDDHDQWQSILGLERRSKLSKPTKTAKQFAPRSSKSAVSLDVNVQTPTASTTINESAIVGSPQQTGQTSEAPALDSPSLPAHLAGSGAGTPPPPTPPVPRFDLTGSTPPAAETEAQTPVQRPEPQEPPKPDLQISLEDGPAVKDEDEVESREELDLKPLLAGFATDYWDGRDLLDTEHDVNALASLVSAWSVEPPLSIGLFGDWGSGKSHFMRQMRKRVEKLSRKAREATEKKQKDIGYYKNIVQIEFNAWHYIEGNLWASLVDHIFANLKVAEKENITIAEARRDALMENLGVKKEIEAKLKTKIVQQKGELETKQKEAADLAKKAQRELDSASRQLAGFVSEAEAELDKVEVPFTFNDRDQALLTSLGINSSRLKTVADYRNRYDELKGIRNRVAAQWKLFWTDPKERRLTLLAAGLTLIPLLGGLLLKLPQMISIPSSIAKLLTVVTPIVVGAVPTWNQVRKSRAALKAKEAEANRELEQKKIELRSEVINLTKKVEESQAEAESIGKDISDLQNKIDTISTSKILAEFIEDRAAAADYRRHLGLLALIRRDFEKLRELFDQQRHEEKQGKESDDVNRINRIILYIDDLDRCPPQRVVEVLQAIHLLLAFPIFVVVVGVDARWVSRSLQESYEWLRLEDEDSKKEDVDGDDDLKRAQGATPHDYLEKIFQIPFWLRPMEETQTQAFIEGLTEQVRYRTSSEKPQLTDGSNGNKVTSESPRTTVAAGPIGEQTLAAGNGQPMQTVDSPPVNREPPKMNEVETGNVMVNPAVEQTVKVEDRSLSLGDALSGTVVEEKAQTPDSAQLKVDDNSNVDADLKGKAEDEDGEDEEVIDLAPNSLTLGDEEITYMKSLAELIGRSPRAVKRFLNCYRLIKVGLTPEQLSNFVQDGASYEFKAVMTLLGIITGAPTASLFVMEELEHWTWSAKKSRPSMADFYDQLEKNEDLLRQPDWGRLKPFLTSFAEGTASRDFFAAFKKNTPRVSRYSFRVARTQAGGPKRASATQSKSSPASKSKLPAPPKAAP